MASFLQAQTFFRLLVGHKTIGVAGDREVQVPYSPELRAFLDGFLSQGPVERFVPRPGPAERRQSMTDGIRSLCDAFDKGPGGPQT